MILRLFIGIALPPEIRASLAETAALCKQRFEANYVPSDLYHITLDFLGNR